MISEDNVTRVILVNHVLAIFRDREKCKGRRSFCAVIRQGGIRCVRSRALKCCDIVLFETSIRQEDKVSEAIVKQSIDRYIKWELRF